MSMSMAMAVYLSLESSANGGRGLAVPYDWIAGVLVLVGLLWSGGGSVSQLSPRLWRLFGGVETNPGDARTTEALKTGP